MSYLDFTDETFNNFAFYSGILLGKTLLMGPITSMARLRNKVFANPEDCKAFGKNCDVITNNSLVERIRRCHQNDLENIVPFTLIGLLYVSAGPDPEKALRVFRVFTAARLLHTVAYLAPLPQPSRAICFAVGVGSTAAMGLFLVARFTFMK